MISGMARGSGSFSRSLARLSLDDQHFGAAMGEELELLRRGQLRVERYQNSAAMKDSARGEMPLGLVRQEDGRAITSSETPALQKCGKGKRATAHFLERETDGLSTAVGFRQESPPAHREKDSSSASPREDCFAGFTMAKRSQSLA